MDTSSVAYRRVVNLLSDRGTGLADGSSPSKKVKVDHSAPVPAFGDSDILIQGTLALLSDS